MFHKQLFRHNIFDYNTSTYMYTDSRENITQTMHTHAHIYTQNKTNLMHPCEVFFFWSQRVFKAWMHRTRPYFTYRRRNSPGHSPFLNIRPSVIQEVTLLLTSWWRHWSNGNLFRVTGPLWGDSNSHRWIPSQRPVTRSFDQRLNKQSGRRWFETPSRSSWRHCNVRQSILKKLCNGTIHDSG